MALVVLQKQKQRFDVHLVYRIHSPLPYVFSLVTANLLDFEVEV